MSEINKAPIPSGHPYRNPSPVTEHELMTRAVAPRVSQADVDAAVRNSYYHVIPDTMMTICALTLQNGYTVIGKSACVNAANFQKDIGERIAREDAYGQVWALLGYALADRMHAEASHIDIVFDGPPGPESGRFVEVENEAGKSVSVGRWIERDDGLWALRIARDHKDTEQAAFIARICYEVNRAYCIGIGDRSFTPWEEAPEWQRQTNKDGVIFRLGNPGVTPEAMHINWTKDKAAAGWKYGRVKDAAKLEHPCMVPYDALPREQRIKDELFSAVVDALR